MGPWACSRCCRRRAAAAGGQTLAAAKVRQLLDEGRLPWAEVWPDNEASLALERSMGFEILGSGSLWYAS